MATLKAEVVRRLIIDPSDPGKVSSQEIVFGSAGRMRDVAAGPDGCLYALTSNRDTRGTPGPGDDKVLKLCPQ